ncbi:hypothetical protein Tco_0618358 [Tanacetum coccineum]
MMEESLNKFMVESAKRHDEHSSLIKEIRASTDVAIRNQGASIKVLEIQIGQMSKDDKMPLINLIQATIPFPGRLKENGYDKEEVLKELKKVESATSLRGLLMEKSRIEKHIKAKRKILQVMENMDAYRDKDMGDIIVGKPFCRNALVEARQFDRFITIGDGNDSVIYQMA